MTKPTANTASVESRAAVGSPFGKNCEAKMGARVPYTAQSTHSTALPIEPATIALRCFPVSRVSDALRARC